MQVVDDLKQSRYFKNVLFGSGKRLGYQYAIIYLRACRTDVQASRSHKEREDVTRVFSYLTV